MRRLALTVVFGTLILTACQDQTQSPTEPTVPGPEATLGTCHPTKFPIVSVSGLIVQVFPAGRLRLEALARAVAVALLWDTCRPTQARQVALAFTDWIDHNAPSTAPAAKVTALKVAILNGVGVPVSFPSGPPDDFGAGLFDPAKTSNTIIKTKSGRALVQLEPGSFLELTVITISRKADNFRLTNFEGRQFPPVYDYDATNASADHVLKNGKTAIVAFCLIGLDDVQFPGGYPDRPRIGHNPVAGAPGFPFEVLDEVDLAAAGLDDDLSPAVCGYTPPGPIIGGFGGGPAGFAKAALWAAGHYLSPLLLPRPLLAATAMGTLPPPPPIGGKASSLSPFDVVEFNQNQLSFTEDPSTNNTSTGNYFKGVTLDNCGDGCYPAVQILNRSGTPVGAGTNVTVSLIQTAGSGGVLGGTLTQPVGSFVSGGTTFPTSAEFNNLTISAPGTYKLKFTAPGAASITSAEFKVYTLAFKTEPWATAGHTFLPTDFLGQTVSGFANPVVQVSIVDYLGGVVTTANDNVVMSIIGGGFLNGTKNVSAVNGVASFTEIVSLQTGLTVSIEADVDGASLQASADYFGTNPVQATSTTFNVHSPGPNLFSVSSFGVDATKRGSLYTIDSNTGLITWVGRLSANPALYTVATNMAMRPSDQEIFVWSNSDGVLLTVNPTTGLGTPVSGTTPPAGTPIQALAFSPSGALYGIEDGAVEGFLSNLVSVDPATGVRTLIGPLGSGLRVSGADFDCNGTLYGLEISTTTPSRLVTIDLGTGAATVVASLSPNMPGAQSIVFMPSGTLTGTSGNLFDINPATGAVSNVRTLSQTDVTPQGLGIARTCLN